MYPDYAHSTDHAGFGKFGVNAMMGFEYKFDALTTLICKPICWLLVGFHQKERMNKWSHLYLNLYFFKKILIIGNN